MALVASGLKSMIISQMTSTIGVPQDPDVQAKFAEAIATAVINYLVANAVVNAMGPSPQGGQVISIGTIS